MIKINQKQNCSGCTACASSCPVGAIEMREDEQGFKYPLIDSEKCIDCGLCDKTCPFVKPLSAPSIRDAYALKHQDAAVLRNSTSGGFFTAVSDYVLEQRGVIYGAAYDENMVVCHKRAETREQRDAMRGSKYVQSDIGSVFSEVKSDLQKGKTVLFTGTPCQIDGLKSFLKGKDDGLICLDLICHGVPSPMIFRAHLHFLAKNLHTKIKNYKFRPKKWGWHVHREIVCGEKREYHSTPYTDLWRDMYYSRVITRPSCNNCPYASLNRVGDITYGDCRGVDKVLPDFGSYEGVTLAIVNTEKGRDVFQKIADRLVYQSINVDDVLQPPLRQSPAPNKKSDAFFSDYAALGYKKTIRKYYGKLYPIKYYVKKILKR